jgi:hypothetical protein
MLRDNNHEPHVFVCGAVYVKKHKIDVKGSQSGARYFFVRRCECKKDKIYVKGHQSEATCFLYAALRM